MSLLSVAAVLATSAWNSLAPTADVSLAGLPLVTHWLRIDGEGRTLEQHHEAGLL